MKKHLKQQRWMDWRATAGIVVVAGLLVVGSGRAAAAGSPREQAQSQGDTGKASRKSKKGAATVVTNTMVVPERMTSQIAPAPVPRSAPAPVAVEVKPPTSLVPKDMAAQLAGKPGGDKTYSFSAKGLDLKDALALFARTFELNILPDPDVTGTVTVDFKNLNLDKAMDALLEVFGYYAEYDRGLIRVKSQQSETFTIDYLRLVRGGTGSSSANIASGSSSGGSGGSGSSSLGGSGGSGGSSGGGEDGASISINHSDTVRFWEELDDQLKVLVSTTGKFVVNRTAGQVFVTDQKANLDRIRQYLGNVRKTLHRQVEIEARIYEVVLNDEFHLGIDWQNIMGKVGDYYISSGGGLTPPVPSSRLIVDNPIGGNTPGAPALSLVGGKNEAAMVVDALKEMGQLKVVSQPRIRTLNNQSALIKVGLDKPFFRQNTTVSTTSGAATTSTSVEVQIITIGTILSITPQISEDGYINLDISPIITRLVRTALGPSGTTAPEVDIKQTSSLVRTKDQATVVIGGLIQDESYKSVRKVPILGDIPLIGRLVTGNYDNTRKTELVIFITPTIVD